MRYLNVSQLRITDDTAYALATCCRNLEVLDMSGCSFVTDVTIRLMGTYCTKIRQLNISSCNLITDEGLACISSLQSLQQLSFANCQRLSGLKLLHLGHLPLTELDISSNQFPPKCFAKLSKYFLKLTKLNLANCVQVTDTLLEIILTKCTRLKHINLGGIPLLTNKTLQLLNSRSCMIEAINLNGDNQFDLAIITSLVEKGLQVIGGQVSLTILRNRTHLDPITLQVEKYTLMNTFRERVLAQLREEKAASEDNWQLEDLLFQKVIYRKNGTKRPSVFVSEKESASVLAAVLGHKKCHLYLQTTKHPEDYTAAQQNIVLSLRRWSCEEKRPVDIGDISVNPNITLREFKQLIHQRYIPNVTIEKMMVVEEETPLHVNILLNNSISLRDYGLVTGDTLHVEETSKHHHTPEGAVGISLTANYLYRHQTTFLIQETTESFSRRRQLALANSEKEKYSRQAVNIEVTLSGWAKLEDLQRSITEMTGIPSTAQRLSTRVHPQVKIEGSQELIVQVVSGNTWIMMEVINT